jgi:hypothetical protein
MEGTPMAASAPYAGDPLGDRFLVLLPRIELHARVYFRFLPGDRKEEAVAETVALAWHWFLRLTERGKDVTQFVSALASYAARAVSSGRRLCGQLPSGDVLSEVAQWRHGFTVQSLPQTTRHPFEEVYASVQGQRQIDALDEMLRDNTVTPPPDQAAFRIDFASWRRTRTERDRRLLADLMVGERTSHVARKHGISAGRVSQLRREFHDDWLRFCGADAGGD